MSNDGAWPPPPPQLRAFHFYKGRQLVLTVEDHPGVLLSTAPPPPDGAPSHPFVHARAYDPYSEDELGALLQQAQSFDEYLKLLIAAGYNAIVVEGSPPIELGVGYRFEDQQGLAGVMWNSPGLFAQLAEPMEVSPVAFEHTTVTVYRTDQVEVILNLLKTTSTFMDFQHQLEANGYRLAPVGEYTI